MRVPQEVENQLQLDALKKNIKHQLVALDWSRAKLAQEARVSKDTLDNLFKENRKAFPYADDLYRIAYALDSTVEELIFGEREKEDTSLAEQIEQRPQLARIMERLSAMSDEELEKAGYGINVALSMMEHEKGDRVDSA